ncbi:MAG: SEL1-like repeat protein [Delftia acidovorans]|nr:SEL1-like repeat protein [Delftia acidovorans]
MPSSAHETSPRRRRGLRLTARLVLPGLLVVLPGLAPAVLPHVQAAARFTPVMPIRVATASVYGSQPGTSNITSNSDTAQQRALSQLRSRAEGKGVSPATQREAQWVMGLLALHGIAMAQDGPQARTWFERAQRAGHPLASAGLAWCAMDGCGQPPDPPAARPWIAQLAKTDPARAQYLEWLLARRLAPLSTAEPVGEALTVAGTPDQELLQRAARSGSPGAQLEWGLALLAALRQFRAAAPRSSSAAANAQMLGDRMRPAGQLVSAQGTSAPPAAQGPQRLQRTPQLRGSPSEQDIQVRQPVTAQQQWEQAQRYHRGEGVPANYTEALRLYQQAASHGHVASRRMLELIYSRPAQGGGVDIGWMQQLARIDPMTMQPMAPISPAPYRRDPTPLFDMVPAPWHRN